MRTKSNVKFSISFFETASKKIGNVFEKNLNISIYLIAPSWKLVGCPLDAAPGKGLPLILDRGHVAFLDELVARKDESLPDGFQRRGIDRVAALVVEEFLVDFVLIVFRGGPEGL